MIIQGRVVRKPVNANLGLKVNRSINFSCRLTFFTEHLCILRLFKLETVGLITYRKSHCKVTNSNENRACPGLA